MEEELRQKIKKHFEPIFKKYDKNQNSTLQKNQLRAILADNLEVEEAAISQDQLDWHFNKIDSKGKGSITFEDYFNHFFGERAKKSIKDQKAASKKEKIAKKEDNQDELIDKEEFRKLMQDTFRPLKIEITEEMVNWNFSQIDKDNSGRITFQEYLAFIKKYNS